METRSTVFMSGNSQAIRIPKAFRLDCKKVTFRKNELTQEIIISPQSQTKLDRELRINNLFNLLEECAQMPDDGFMFRDEVRANEKSLNVFDDDERTTDYEIATQIKRQA